MRCAGHANQHECEAGHRSGGCPPVLFPCEKFCQREEPMTITTPSPAGGSVPGGGHASHAGDSPPGSGARPSPYVPGVTHRFVDVRGARLHVAEAGDGDPVVLLHSFPQHWYAWRHVVPLLAGQYRLIIPDWRGVGRSGAPPRGAHSPGTAAPIPPPLDAPPLRPGRLRAPDAGAPPP